MWPQLACQKFYRLHFTIFMATIQSHHFRSWSLGKRTPEALKWTLEVLRSAPEVLKTRPEVLKATPKVRKDDTGGTNGDPSDNVIVVVPPWFEVNQLRGPGESLLAFQKPGTLAQL